MKNRKAETDGSIWQRPVVPAHTPTPWHDVESFFGTPNHVFVMGQDSQVIADCGLVTGETERENAAFIVTAVNSYERNDAFLDQMEDDLIELQSRIEKSKVTDGEFAHGILTGRVSLAKEIVDKLQAHFEAIRNAEGE